MREAITTAIIANFREMQIDFQMVSCVVLIIRHGKGLPHCTVLILRYIRSLHLIVRHSDDLPFLLLLRRPCGTAAPFDNSYDTSHGRLFPVKIPARSRKFRLPVPAQTVIMKPTMQEKENLRQRTRGRI